VKKPPSLLLFLLSFAFVLTTAAPSPARAADSDAEQRAEELEIKAREAARAGKLDEAASTLRAAWDLARWSSIACNLGRVEFARRRFRDAAEFLSLCVDSAPPVRTPEEKKRFASAVEQLAEARANIVSLLLAVNEPEATVLLDGQRAATPPVPRVLFVEPGRHRVSASLEGFTPASVEIQGSAGDTIEVDLTLRAVPAAPPPVKAPPPVPRDPPRPLLPIADTPPPPPPPQPTNSRALAVTILGIGAGVFTVAGVTSSVFAGSAHTTMQRESQAFQRQQHPCKPIGCGAPEAHDTYVRTKNAALSTLVLGGVLGAAACLTGLWPHASPPRTARATPAVFAW
jgi:hypothetical protein